MAVLIKQMAIVFVIFDTAYLYTTLDMAYMYTTLNMAYLYAFCFSKEFQDVLGMLVPLLFNVCHHVEVDKF